MRILVACEESQAVTIELRKLGHEAYSCDIVECSGGHPEWHTQGDALKLINGSGDNFGQIYFVTQDNTSHLLPRKWDMIIAHPPCTYLSAAGASRMFPVKGGPPDPERFAKGQEAAAFFTAFLEAECPRIAVENPVPMKCFGLPAYNQIVQPYLFGEPWYKRTCFWLKGLEELRPTTRVEPQGYWVQRSGKRTKGCYGGHRDPKKRSKTFPGIAKAMAEQWAGCAYAK